MSASVDNTAGAVRAAIETNARLIASLLNEGLLRGEAAACPDKELTTWSAGVRLLSPGGGAEGEQELWVGTTGQHDAHELWHQADFCNPILARELPRTGQLVSINSPVDLARRARAIITETVNGKAWDGVLEQLESSFQNMTAWIDWGQSRPLPSLKSRMVDWEQAVVVGHPVHPMGRSLVAACGLPKISPSEAPTLTQPSISFLAVDRAELWVTGPFRKILTRLLVQFRLPRVGPNEIIVPCLTRQIPAILRHSESARVICQDAFKAAAQASLRTVTVPDRLDFPFSLKFSLSYTISSVLRAITPHSACSAIEVSNIVEDCVTEDTWVCKEIAATASSHADRTAARQMTCIVREDHEARARALGQSLIIVAALGETSTRSSECVAALMFGLDNSKAKLAWLRSYAAKLFYAVCTPAIESGVGLEAHGQNTMVRVDNATKTVVGFCFRDFGSVRCHTSTLRKRGFRMLTTPAETWLLTENEEEVWDQVQHTAIHNHLQLLVRQLNVELAVAWRSIRDELDVFFAAYARNSVAIRMHAYMTRPIVKIKALLRMRMSEVTDDDLYVDAPNVLFRPASEYQPIAPPIPHQRDVAQARILDIGIDDDYELCRLLESNRSYSPK